MNNLEAIKYLAEKPGENMVRSLFVYRFSLVGILQYQDRGNWNSSKGLDPLDFYTPVIPTPTNESEAAVLLRLPSFTRIYTALLDIVDRKIREAK